jgi:hypothetical protein
MASVVTVRTDDAALLSFEAAVHRVGQVSARTAFARAMNHEGRKGTTALKRMLRKTTSVRISHINEAISFHPASKYTLKTIVRGIHRPISLRYFGPRQFKYGVRAKVWGRAQRYKGAFIVRSLGGSVFKNTGGFNRKSGRNNAIEKLWGPIIPKEMITTEVEAAFLAPMNNVADRAAHELSRILAR